MVMKMGDKEQKGFVVYGDYKAVIDELDDEQVGKLFRGMMNYFVNGDEPNFADVLKFVFIPIKQQMDRDGSKYAKKCERNRQNANMRWDANGCDRIKKMRTDAIDANKDKDTNKDKDKDKDTNKKPHESGNKISPALLSYLNSQTGGTFEETEQFDELIQNLIDAGYTEEQIRTVIRKKACEWACDGKMRTLLRPSVLFGDKFEEYLNAPDPIEIEEQAITEEKAEQLREDLKTKIQERDAIEERIRQIRDDDSISENYDEYNAAKLNAAILEQEIESINARLGAS